MAPLPPRHSLSTIGLYGYLLFVISWSLHLPARIAVLGTLRIDLLLVAFLAYVAFSQRERGETHAAQPDKLLRVLLVFAVFMIPFAEWPGSVIKNGIPNLIKAVVFYYFTVAFVRSEADLRKFFVVFVSCQALRVIEPLYLHLTQGYWGSAASQLGGAESLYRLSGSPYDVINPNGLAYVCCTVLLFLYFFRQTNRKIFLAFLLFAPLCIYTLSLTGSRTGILALLVVFAGIIFKSRHRVALSLVLLLTAVVTFQFLSPDMQDRYWSIIGRSEKNQATADERYGGMAAQWDVAMRRPLRGYGLGTSPEANFHYTVTGPYVGKTIPAHNLYLEVLQELGIVGLGIFLLFMRSVLVSFFKIHAERWKTKSMSPFLPRVIDAMQVWLAMDIVSSFGSYGLSNYDWYLFAGLSLVMKRIGGSHSA